TVLIIQDTAACAPSSNQQLLAADGILFDMIPSSALGGTDLSRYRLVIVPSDQPTSTYATLASCSDQLRDYVASGHVLEFHAAGWGSAGGNASLVTLPGGVQISQYSSNTNTVVRPQHPLMAGVPNPIYGGYARHAYFS